MSVFGKIITAAEVEQAAITTVATWQQTYAGEIERQHSMAAQSLPLFRSITTSNEFSKFPEDQLPALVVVSPGLQGRPVAEGDGRYRAPFMLGMAAVCSADTRENTNKLAKTYAALLRAIIVQAPSLGGISRGVTWENESYDDIKSEDQRTLASAQVIFTVDVGDVVHSKKGLVDPAASPYTAQTAPVATRAIVNTQKKVG